MLSQHRSSMSVRIILILALIGAVITVMPAFASPSVMYVNGDATGLNNGSSWVNAYSDLQSALRSASSGTEIWVAAGTYKPGSDRASTFSLKEGVALYGGFAGNEIKKEQRDPAVYITVLSGDLNGDDNGNIFPDEPTRAENVYHVISSSGVGNTAILDGFTVKGGNANLDRGQQTARGGGMWNGAASPILRNVTFTANTSLEIGGGMYNEGNSEPLLDHVTFNNNTSEGGGGLANYQSHPTLLAVSFRSNMASFSGGGMLSVSNSSPVLKDVTFEGNFASTFGGGMSSYDSVLSVANTTFSYNMAQGLYNADHDPGQTPPYGGGMYNFNSNGSVVNSTFTGNRAGNGGFPSYGTGIGNRESSLTFTHITLNEFVDGMMNDASSPVIQNSILWGTDRGTSSFTAISDTNNSNSQVSDSAIRNGFPAGINIITADPLLDTLGNYGGGTQTMPLRADSPVIDKANSSYCPATDQRGAPRVKDTCDLGSYERVQYTISGNTGVGGVNVSYEGSFPYGRGMIVSDSLGNYTLPILYGWSGTIYTYKSGYRFTPDSRNYINVQGDQTAQDYAATPVFTISGNAGVGGATLSYTDEGQKTVTANNQGSYQFSVPDGWSGMVVPSALDYIFVPAAREYSNVHANEVSQDYAAIQVIFTISGNVRYADVTLSYMENGNLKTIISDNQGNYSFKVNAGWSGTVTPFKPSVVFEPASKSYVNIQSNQVIQNYRASIPVTSLADSGPGSLRNVIAGAEYGDMITFHPDLAGQTIFLASPLSIGKGLTINGSGLNPRIEISGSGSVKIFAVDMRFDPGGKPRNAKFQSLVLKNGRTAIAIGGGNIFIEDVSFVGNSADYGGAIASCCTNTAITITHSDFISNSAQYYGGAIYTNFGSLTVKSSTFSNNSAGSVGGAISIEREGPYTFEDNTFSNNTALSGGAIRFESVESPIIIRRNLFSGNTATGYGGAIFELFASPSFQVENNTFYANQANNGGAIVLSSFATLVNNTFSHNRATQNGASLYLSHAYLYNNILANTTAVGECYINNNGSVISSNNIIEGGSANCGATSTQDPLLGTLAYYGGSTQTMALLPGSPAINAGDDSNCPAADQRGITRPQGGHCDIGAYEYETIMSVTPTFIPTDTPTFAPTATATFTPAYTPTSTPTPTASLTPSQTSTFTPVYTPTRTFTPSPTFTKTLTPTATKKGQIKTPTSTPTSVQNMTPTRTPTRNATSMPTKTPRKSSFVDVPSSHVYLDDIEILYANGLTGGCSTSPLSFCPDQIMNRGQAAVFMLRGNFGNSFVPDQATHLFQDDWSKGAWAESWAEAMKNNGLSSGCLASPLKYCPWDQIPREQAVIFALRLKYGIDYQPPAATGTLLADMTDASFYTTAWAEQAYREGLIPSCGTSGNQPMICPKALVSRGLAAYMIVRAKDLTMP